MWIIFLHVATIFVAFALTTGVGIFFTQVLRSGDPRAIRAASRAAVPLVTVGGILFLVAVAFGIGAGVRLGFPFNSSWLVVTYVLVALIAIDGFLIRAPWVRRVASAAQASPDDRPSAELSALTDSRLAAATGPLSGLLWLATLIMMTVKPHFW